MQLSVHGLFAVAAIACAFATSPVLAECGDRGGPGYRGPNGQCVSWVSIGKVCGCPPTTRCTAERTQLGAEKAAALGCEIQKLRSQSVPAKGD